MSSGKVVLISGASASIGEAMSKIIAARPEKVTLLATSRKGVDLGIKPANPESKVLYPKLDVSSDESVASLKEYVKAQVGGKVDVMILNAGGNPTLGQDVSDDVKAQQNLDLNYYSAKRMIDAFAPIMPKGGRVCIVSSSASFQTGPDTPLIKAVQTKGVLSSSELDALAQGYVEALKTPAAEDKSGWPREGFEPAYSLSKGFANVLAATKAKEYPDLLINAACPGVCDSRGSPKDKATGFAALWVYKTVEEGARLPLRVSFEDINGVTGKFWTGKTSADRGPGQVTEDWAGKEIVWDLVQ